jgi:hypothetical protein
LEISSVFTFLELRTLLPLVVASFSSGLTTGAGSSGAGASGAAPHPNHEYTLENMPLEEVFSFSAFTVK